MMETIVPYLVAVLGASLFCAGSIVFLAAATMHQKATKRLEKVQDEILDQLYANVSWNAWVMKHQEKQKPSPTPPEHVEIE